ncbi:MAG: thiamine pyrophosphate-binding protein [Betaproteobacteria bacterium]|nr:thiamine pyrophosphate-binding protein [Betaproteobacteria bacterium]
MLIAAEAPMIHAGSGVIHAGAYDALRRVAELLHAPVTTSWAARGLTERPAAGDPDAARQAQPPRAQRGRRGADPRLARRRDRLVGKPPYWRDPSEQRTIQVDIDGDMMGPNAGRPRHRRRCESLPRAARGCARAAQGRDSGDGRRARIAAYGKRIVADRAGWDKALADGAVPMHPAHIASTCRAVFPKGTVLVADGGNAAIWTMFHHLMEVPNTLLSTFKFGMLGAGPAQAIGAAVARPGQPVCCIIGDGAMGFHPQEIESAIRLGAPVVFIVMVDRQWGMVKMNQQFMLRPIKTMLFKHLDADETIKADLGEIKWDDLARSMGAHGERVAEAADAAAGDRARTRVRGLRGGARGRGPGEAHVGARAVALQEDARGAEGLERGWRHERWTWSG